MRTIFTPYYCFLLLASIVSLSSSCQKENTKSDTTTVSGTITDATTGKGIPNATIVLLRKKTDVLSSAQPAPFDSFKADDNGHFSYSFKQENGYSHYVSPSMPVEKYWEVSQPTSINEGKYNSISLTMNPKGYIKIHIKTQNNNITEINTYFNKWGSVKLYSLIDTTILDYNYGNKKNIYNLWVTYSNNSVLSKKDSVYCPAFDTITHEFIID